MSQRSIKSLLDTFTKVLDQIPDLKYVGDPILRASTKSVTVAEGIEIGKRLGTILLKYREIAKIGRGLAAPQIGLNKSVFVTFVEEKLQMFINPVVIKKSSKTNFYRELCLSSGIISADVERPDWIELMWTDEEGVNRIEKFDGVFARLLQHEEAHLRGVVNLDEAAPKGIAFATLNPLDEHLRDTRS